MKQCTAPDNSSNTLSYLADVEAARQASGLRQICLEVNMQRSVPLTNLRHWLTSHGGWIHPAIAAGFSPQYGCR